MPLPSQPLPSCYPHLHRRARPRLRQDLQPAAQRLGALAHARQAQAASVGRGGDVKADAIIFHVELQPFPICVEVDGHGGGGSVPQGVVERLLGNAVQPRLDRRGQIDLTVDRQANLEAGAALYRVQALLERSHQPFLSPASAGAARTAAAASP